MILAVRSSLWLVTEDNCRLCGSMLNENSVYEIIFPKEGFRIHRVCKDCYKEAYMRTNKLRIYKKMLMEV